MVVHMCNHPPVVAAMYIVATNDRAIPPSLEQAMADMINASTISIPGSHDVMLSHRIEVADVIIQAAC